jgi:hypothetical protein
MKIYILILLFPLFGYSQISDTCFTSQEIHNISETLDSLFYISDINDKIIKEQDSLISYLERVILLDSLELKLHNTQIELLNDNIELYIQREKIISSKWYEHPAIWFIGGIGTTILTGRLVVLLIN